MEDVRIIESVVLFSSIHRLVCRIKFTGGRTDAPAEKAVPRARLRETGRWGDHNSGISPAYSV